VEAEEGPAALELDRTEWAELDCADRAVRSAVLADRVACIVVVILAFTGIVVSAG
jgi:hypothetical protein